MRGQVTRGILTGFLGGLLLVGCGSNGGAQVDAPYERPRTPDAGPPQPPPDAPDAAAPVGRLDAARTADCDEGVFGESNCIINSDNGSGTLVKRVPAVNWATCKQ